MNILDVLDRVPESNLDKFSPWFLACRSCKRVFKDLTIKEEICLENTTNLVCTCGSKNLVWKKEIDH